MKKQVILVLALVLQSASVQGAFLEQAKRAMP